MMALVAETLTCDHQHDIIPSKMQPWITKKVREYLGAEEATLVQFIATKLSTHSAPQDIRSELAPIFEEEANEFVLKMWRALIFEMLRVSAP